MKNNKFIIIVAMILFMASCNSSPQIISNQIPSDTSKTSSFNSIEEITDSKTTEPIINIEGTDNIGSPENDNPKDLELIGNVLEFEDSVLKDCALKALESSGDVITDYWCEQITELDCSDRIISTLADLKYFSNLIKLIIDNSDREVSLKGINKATKLKSVTLKNCKLSEVDRISELKDLEYLDISTSSSRGTKIKDYSSLSALTNLKYLDMSWTGYNAYNPFGLEDASFINSLVNLEELNIYETGISNYSLGNLSKLKKLTISECIVDNILEELCNSGSIYSIEDITIYGAGYGYFLTNDGLKNYLSQAKELKHLKLGITETTSLEGLGELQNLETFYFDNSRCFDLPLSAYDEFKKLKNLKELTLVGNANSHEIVNNLGTNPNDYKFLNEMSSLVKLSIEPYKDMAISCFSDLNNLEILSILNTDTYDTDVDISGIDKFKSLKELNYRCVRFKSTAPLDDLDYLSVNELSFYS